MINWSEKCLSACWQICEIKNQYYGEKSLIIYNNFTKKVMLLLCTIKLHSKFWPYFCHILLFDSLLSLANLSVYFLSLQEKSFCICGLNPYFFWFMVNELSNTNIFFMWTLDSFKLKFIILLMFFFSFTLISEINNSWSVPKSIYLLLTDRI